MNSGMRVGVIVNKNFKCKYWQVVKSHGHPLPETTWHIKEEEADGNPERES